MVIFFFRSIGGFSSICVGSGFSHRPLECSISDHTRYMFINPLEKLLEQTYNLYRITIIDFFEGLRRERENWESHVLHGVIRHEFKSGFQNRIARYVRISTKRLSYNVIRVCKRENTRFQGGRFS